MSELDLLVMVARRVESVRRLGGLIAIRGWNRMVLRRRLMRLVVVDVAIFVMIRRIEGGLGIMNRAGKSCVPGERLMLGRRIIAVSVVRVVVGDGCIAVRSLRKGIAPDAKIRSLCDRLDFDVRLCRGAHTETSGTLTGVNVIAKHLFSSDSRRLSR